MAELLSYENRTVVVTGCASGVGMHAARLLKESGARVIGLDRKRAENVDEFVELDLSDPGSIERAAARISEFDCLFNIAGISSGGGDPATVVSVNFLGTRMLTERLVGRIGRGGAVASVASISGFRYLENLGTSRQLVATPDFESGLRWCKDNPTLLTGGGYQLSKEAIIVFTLQRALVYGAQSIRFNCIGPGVIETPFLADTIKSKGTAALDTIPKPLGRISHPSEQASALVFLNSRAASYVNGHVLWVDGGFVGGVAMGMIPERLVANARPDSA